MRDLPILTPITVQVQDPDYRFIELCNLESSGHATGEEIAELEAMCAVKEQWSVIRDTDPETGRERVQG